MIIDESIMQYYPWPKIDAHKHSRGRLMVFSGDMLHTGAARLAANCGARIGAGWVVICAPFEASKIIATHETSIMVRAFEYKSEAPDDLDEYNSALIGPALGFDNREEALLAIINTYIPLLLDADAITIISKDKAKYFAAFKARKSQIVLTPHEGEFFRLFGKKGQNLEEKTTITIEAAKLANAIIVHKGAKTVIAAPNGEFAILEDTTPFLATAGTGDCLCGIIAGLLAQNVDGFIAAKIGVFIHAKCGQYFGAALMAQDIMNVLPKVLNTYAPQNLKARA